MENNNMNEEVMALPPELDNIKDKKIKKSHLFSKAIFRESLKSNGKALATVSLCNGALIAVVVGILSTLNINATSTAMKNLFSSAGDESTIKQGSISYYNSYYNSALAYDEVYESTDTLNNVTTNVIGIVGNETLKASVAQLQAGYDQYYAATKSDSYAYTQIMSLAQASVSQMDLSEEEKVVMLGVINGYFTLYMSDKSLSYNEMMYQVVPSVFEGIIATQYSLSEDTSKKVKTLLSNSINEVYVTGNDAQEVAYRYGLEIGKLLSSSEDAYYLLNNIEEEFLKDTDKWFNEENYKELKIKDVVLNKVIDTAESTAYYAYLPDFEVLYRTSDLGYPVKLVDSGTRDSKGNVIYKEEECKEYTPEKFIKIDGKTGTKATSLEKRRKLALTGEDYTEEEIKQAKIDAQDDISSLKTDLDSFLTEYVSRDLLGLNEYFDGENAIESAITSRAIDDVAKKAEKQLIQDYNDKYSAGITSVDQIPAATGRNSGSTTMNLIYSYGSGAIASYKEIYAKKVSAGYSSDDASLIALNVAGKGIMDQLSVGISDSLSEMGEMNTYGIVLGGIGFALACLLVPMGYTIMLANDLVAKKVENGSLAFTFSTPIKRNTYIFTEGMYLIFSETVMALVLLCFGLAARQIGIACGSADIETSITVEYMLKFALGNYLVTLAISSICFFTSSLFNKTTNAVGVGGGISIFFYICSILGLFGTKTIPATIRIESMNYFNYCTIMTLFDTNAVLNADNVYWYKLIGLVGIALVMYFASFKVFEKKDLPL